MPAANAEKLRPARRSSSQSPAAARHSVPALPAACWQVVLVPSQVSVVHGLPSSAHAVPLGCVASVGQAVFVPSQTLATSQLLAAARHSVPAFPAARRRVGPALSQVSV